MVHGEVYLAHFPFGAGAGMKLWPVLLLTGPIGMVPEILVAYISSAVPHNSCHRMSCSIRGPQTMPQPT
jgi:hypothetical protein